MEAESLRRRRQRMVRLRRKNEAVLDTKTADGRDLIIRAEHVVKVYDTGITKLHALKGIDLELRRGEMAAVMGPSGCGKTTLLNCLSGLDEIDGGRILIEGVDLTELPDRARTRYRAERMGFVFQFYNLMPVLSAVENVELSLLLAGRAPKAAR